MLIMSYMLKLPSAQTSRGNVIFNGYIYIYIYILGFTPSKAEQTLQSMELQEKQKDAQKIKA